MPIDLNTKCRTCLSESSSYYQLFDDAEENCKILEMLDCIVPQINIKSTLQFSTLVCQICVEKLLIGYKFQQLCIKSNKRLQDSLGVGIVEEHQKFEMIVNPLTTVIDDSHNRENEECVNSQPFLDELKLEEVADIHHNNFKKNRTFQCRSCPKSFEKKTSLSAHCKVHKNKELCQNKRKNLVSELQAGPEPTKQSRTITKEELLKDSQKCDEIPDSRVNKSPIESELDGTKSLNSINTDSTNIELGSNENTNNKYVFECKVCGKIFDRSCNLQRHNSVHSLARPFECEMCKYRFSDAKIFKAHLFQHKGEGGQNISQHLPEGFKCEVCQKDFMSMKQLAKHFKNQHPGVDKHKCDYCSRTFILHDSLLKHINHRHKCDKSLLCQICKKAFGNAYRLKQHTLVHNSYLCPHCGKTFRGASNLRQHMERHTGLQKYQCPDCPKRFNCKSDVIKHASAHSNAKPHVCDICGSRFTRKYSMQKHKSLHTAERSYKCDQCNMSFKLISLLKRHMRTHTGEKPYKCKYCERAYSESGDLTKHLRTHVGENTYMCDQCPMAFKYQAELRQHQSQHYKMELKFPLKTQDTTEKTRQENTTN